MDTTLAALAHTLAAMTIGLTAPLAAVWRWVGGMNGRGLTNG